MNAWVWVAHFMSTWLVISRSLLWVSKQLSFSLIFLFFYILHLLSLFIYSECAMPCEETFQSRNLQLDRDANPWWPSVWFQYQEENWISNSFVWRWVQVPTGWLWYALLRQNFVRYEWRSLSGRCHDTNHVGSSQWWTKEQSSRYFMLFISKSFFFPFFNHLSC